MAGPLGALHQECVLHFDFQDQTHISADQACILNR